MNWFTLLDYFEWAGAKNWDAKLQFQISFNPWIKMDVGNHPTIKRLPVCMKQEVQGSGCMREEWGTKASMPHSPCILAAMQSLFHMNQFNAQVSVIKPHSSDNTYASNIYTLIHFWGFLKLIIAFFTRTAMGQNSHFYKLFHSRRFSGKKQNCKGETKSYMPYTA